MGKIRTVYDISVSLGGGSIDYPGDTPFRSEPVMSLEKGNLCNLSQLVMSAHAGTHLDAPAHFIKDGRKIDSYLPEDFILPAWVVETSEDQPVGEEDLAGLDIKSGEALLLKTANSRTGRCRSGKFTEDFCALTPRAARLCADKGTALVGIDYITIEEYGNKAFDAHHVLLGGGIPILEGIDLLEVPPGRYTLVCLPLKLKGIEASPVRAVLIKGELGE